MGKEAIHNEMECTCHAQVAFAEMGELGEISTTTTSPATTVH